MDPFTASVSTPVGDRVAAPGGDDGSRDGAATGTLTTDRPSPPRRPAEPVRGDIQGLRAVAVLIVLLFHFWPEVLTGGYVGVDVFFVISGFLISSHLLRSPPTTPRRLGAFWARRVRRLLPAASLVLATTLVLTPIMTYWVLPFVTRMLRRWLAPRAV